MSGASLDSSRPLGPTEAPSIGDSGLDLSKTSLNPLEDRASTAVRHQGDRAWKADQVVVPTERVRVDRSTATSALGDARETNTVTSDFRGINQVGEEEYQRTLASMRSEGASDQQAYAVATETRNRVTSVGGTEIEREREALQQEQAAEALDVLEADGLEEGVAAADVDRDAQTEAVGISEEEGLDVADRDTNLDPEAVSLENGIAEDQAGLDTLAVPSGLAEEGALDSRRQESLANGEGGFEAVEAALSNGNVLDLDIEKQFSLVEALKNARVEKLTTAPTLSQDSEFGVEQEIDPQLARQIDAQFEEIRGIVDRRQAALWSEEPLIAIKLAQRALGPTEKEALTF